MFAFWRLTLAAQCSLNLGSRLLCFLGEGSAGGGGGSPGLPVYRASRLGCSMVALWGSESSVAETSGDPSCLSSGHGDATGMGVLGFGFLLC